CWSQPHSTTARDRHIEVIFSSAARQIAIFYGRNVHPRMDRISLPDVFSQHHVSGMSGNTSRDSSPIAARRPGIPKPGLLPLGRRDPLIPHERLPLLLLRRQPRTVPRSEDGAGQAPTAARWATGSQRTASASPSALLGIIFGGKPAGKKVPCAGGGQAQ